jgi:hypothetical protein
MFLRSGCETRLLGGGPGIEKSVHGIAAAPRTAANQKDPWSARLSLSETKFGWQVKLNRAMFLSYEGSLQPDLVGAGIIVPIAGLVGSRDLGPSASD